MANYDYRDFKQEMSSPERAQTVVTVAMQARTLIEKQGGIASMAQLRDLSAVYCDDTFLRFAYVHRLVELGVLRKTAEGLGGAFLNDTFMLTSAGRGVLE